MFPKTFQSIKNIFLSGFIPAQRGSQHRDDSVYKCKQAFDQRGYFTSIDLKIKEFLRGDVALKHLNAISFSLKMRYCSSCRASN